MMRACKQLKGGLQDVADDLGVSLEGHVIQSDADLQTGPPSQGATYRIFTSSRVRLTFDREHLLQNARVIF